MIQLLVDLQTKLPEYFIHVAHAVNMNYFLIPGVMPGYR